MTKFFSIIWLFGCTPNLQTIDIQINGATIYNVNGPQQRTLYIHKGRFITPNSDTVEVTQILDWSGKHLMAGLHDGHTHLLAGSFVFDKLLLVGVASMSSILVNVQNYVNTEPDVPWVVGYGWILSGIDNPSGILLDDVSNEYPVALFDSSGHNLLVNSKALELAGITRDTVAPDDGIIHLDTDGNPTGFLQEGAIELVSNLVTSSFSQAEIGANLEDQIRVFNQGGITSISEILAVPGVNLSSPEIYHQIESPSLRVSYYIPIFEMEDLNDIQQYVDDETEWTRFAGIKLWVDGSSSSGESWSLEPSDIDEDHYGSQYFELEDIEKAITHAETHHYDVKLHVNGDAAVRTALDAMENVRSNLGQLNRRYNFEHVVLVNPEDYDRMYNLGVIASIQPSHALVGIYGDQADHWDGGRIDRAWDFPSLEDNDIPIAIGTDWPVWPTPDGVTNWKTSTAGLQSRNLQHSTVMEGYSNVGRVSSGWSPLTFAEGDFADFIVLSSDPSDSIDSVEILETWIDGRRVY